MERQVVGKAQKSGLRGKASQPRPSSSSLVRHPLMQLQSIGNQALQRLISSPFIQTKLQVSTPGDPFEQEADRVADTVMRMPEPNLAIGKEEGPVQAKSLATGIHRLVQRAPVAVREDDDEEKVSTKLDGSVNAIGDGIQSKSSTDVPVNRKLGEAEENEAVQAVPVIQRREEEVQRKLMFGQQALPPQVFRRAHDNVIHRLCTECEEEEDGQAGAVVHRKAAPGEEEEQVQAQATGSPAPALPTSLAANVHALNAGGGSPLSATTRSFFEPRFGADFSQVRVHTDAGAAGTAKSINARAFTVGRSIAFGAGQYAPESHEGRRLLAHELTHVVQQKFSSTYTGSAIQRQVASATPASGATPDRDKEATTAGMIVEDTATDLQPGQMKKSEFLAELRARVCRAAEAVLAETGDTTRDCPYLDFWFGYYALKESRHIERAIQRYAPEASGAATARDYIPVIVESVRRSVAVWAMTRQITGIPEGLPTDSGIASSSESGGSSARPTGGIQFKAHDGGVRGDSNPQAIKTQLGSGSPLDGGVRSRMESAFGRSFSQVRVHTDVTAAALSDGLNARAFTVGEHIAFGSSEYRPGSLIGDAIIAHELAHVMQQGSASNVIAPTQMGQGSYDQFEEDADQSAMAAGISLWGRTKGVLNGITQNIKPRLKSGLQLRACRRTVHQCPRGLRWAVVGRPTATGPVCVCAWRCLPPGVGFSLYSDSGESSGPSISCANRDRFGRCPGEPNYETVDEDYGVENEGTKIGVGAHMSPLGGQGACGCLPLNIEGDPSGQTEVHAPMLPPGLDVTALAGMRGRPARDPRTGVIDPGARTAPPPAGTRAPTTQVGPAGGSRTPPPTPAAPRTTPAPTGTTPRPAGPTPAGIPRGTAPAPAENAAAHAAANSGAAQPGFVGNRAFANDGRGGGTVLPRQANDGTAITYREYDIHPHRPGVNRGAERVVIGSDGRRYYTSDHYRTFHEF